MRHDGEIDRRTRRVDAHQAAWPFAKRIQALQRGVDVGKGRHQLCQQMLTGLRRRDVAGGTVQQANAHLRFQLAQGVSQRRRRHAQSGGGAADGTLYVGLITSGNAAQTAGSGVETFFPGADTVFASNALRLDEQRGLLWGTRRTFSPAAKRAPTASMR